MDTYTVAVFISPNGYILGVTTNAFAEAHLRDLLEKSGGNYRVQYVPVNELEID